MSNSIEYSGTTLVLPSDLLWADEFAWQEVAQNKRYSVTGRLLIESGLRRKGRPITLAGSEGHGWITRGDLLTLLAWRALPGQVFNLIVRGEAPRTVEFNHEAGAIDAAPIIDYSDPEDADQYRVTLRFTEV